MTLKYNLQFTFQLGLFPGYVFLQDHRVHTLPTSCVCAALVQCIFKWECRVGIRTGVAQWRPNWPATSAYTSDPTAVPTASDASLKTGSGVGAHISCFPGGASLDGIRGRREIYEWQFYPSPTPPNIIQVHQLSVALPMTAFPQCLICFVSFRGSVAMRNIGLG